MVFMTSFSFFMSIFRNSILVQCVLQFVFRDEGYTGVIELQDALNKRQMLYSMPVKTHYMSSYDGKKIAKNNPASW